MTYIFKHLKTKDNGSWLRSVVSFVAFLATFLCSMALDGQMVSGTVTSDKDGSPLIGASVLEKGTVNGTVTDIDGNFSLKIGKMPAVLEVSYLGYGNKDVQVSAAQNNLQVSMSEGTALDEVVVTALGISREKKSLTYALDEIKGENLTTFKDANVVNSLQGRSAGLFIGRSGSGIGGSTRVVLRGNKSTTNNSPLYVIDGVPMNNSNGGQQGGIFGGGVDTGDGISNINPEDIESMSVLKGASAAALYGSGAVNGVILVTTKKGKSGKPKISLSSSYVSEAAFSLPELQYSYGQGADGSEFSWGTKGSFTDHVGGFFQNGSNFINSVSISGGTDVTQSYFSYSNTKADGIIPNNNLSRHNFNFNQTASFFKNKLNLKASVNFINQDVQNRPAAGLYFNPLTGLYLLPRGLDFTKFKNEYENPDGSQNWHADADIQQNPYWIVNRNLNSNIRNRVISGLSASYAINNWLNVQFRGNIDKSFDTADQKLYAGTQTTLAHSSGRYLLNKTEGSLLYGDVIFNVQKKITDKLNFGANIGSSHNTNSTSFNNIDSGTGGAEKGGLIFRNKFNTQNIRDLLNNGSARQGISRIKTNSIFASGQFAYDNFLYLDVTGRNDWTSSLPDQSFFYPSVGLSSIISEKVNLGAISFAKVRASYAVVGSGVPAYLNNDLGERHQIVNGNLVLTTSGVIEGSPLRPEKSKSLEFGVDLRALDNRLSVDLTYYKNNTIDQFIQVSAPVVSGFTSFFVNAGDIQNSGIEGLIGYDVINKSTFKWNTSINFTKNTNSVKAVHPSLDKSNDGKDGIAGNADDVKPAPLFISDEGVNSYKMVMQKGGQFGDIWGIAFDRDDQGRIKLDDKGVPTKKDGFQNLGNSNPDFMLGLNNEFTIKNVNVRFLIDGRFGGKVMSISQSMLDLFGVSQATADARDAGGVVINAVAKDGTSVTKIDAQTYYSAVGGRNGITEAYMYDATNVRLREVSIGFKLPKTIISGNGVLKGARISLIGRNIFFITKKAPFDPDLTFSTGVGLQGVDVFSLPTTRSYGVSLSVDL